jgi:hypothetical protein
VDAGEESEEETHGLSGALVEDLTAHRTAALRAVLATRPDVALVAAAHNLALQVCYVPSYESPSALSLKPDKGACQLDRHAKGIETSLAQKTLSGLHAQWLKRIPADPDALGLSEDKIKALWRIFWPIASARRLMRCAFLMSLRVKHGSWQRIGWPLP